MYDIQLHKLLIATYKALDNDLGIFAAIGIGPPRPPRAKKPKIPGLRRRPRQPDQAGPTVALHNIRPVRNGA